ncbi:MAG: multiprotein-bridging factor 1 family protein [Prochloraceae cyanobacterium]
MDLEERKQLFADLLQEMLHDYQGVKSQLARKLDITPQRLAPWLQGKIDPGELGIETFTQLAKLKGYQVDKLANFLGLFEDKIQNSVLKFSQLIGEMLEGISQEELAKKLSVSQNTISKWLDPDKAIEPRKITTNRMVAIAQEKGWTLEKLLIYLGIEKTSHQLLEKPTNQSISFSSEQIVFLTRLCDRVFEEIKKQEILLDPTRSDSPPENLGQFFLLFEKENNTITQTNLNLAQRASEYTGNLVQHLQIRSSNIKIGTIDSIPETLADTDLLIFDISTADSASISFIEDLEFNGEIIIFTEAAALTVIRERLRDRVSSIFSKPFDWSTLKSQPFFQRGN